MAESITPNRGKKKRQHSNLPVSNFCSCGEDLGPNLKPITQYTHKCKEVKTNGGYDNTTTRTS